MLRARDVRCVSTIASHTATTLAWTLARTLARTLADPNHTITITTLAGCMRRGP
jgi:hypothetical protein